MPQLAAYTLLELAEALKGLGKHGEALPVYGKAGGLLSEAGHLSDLVSVRAAQAECHMARSDHHTALLVLQELANLLAEHDECGMFKEVGRETEVTMLLLLLIIQPSQHNTAPNLLQVLDKYRDLDAHEEDAVKLSPSTRLLLTSLVLAVESSEIEALLFLQDQLHPLLTRQQNSLLKIVVTNTMSKV